MAKNNCAICNKELGMMSGKVLLKDAVICTSCANKLPKLSGGYGSYTLNEANKAIQRMEEKVTVTEYEGATPEYVVLQVVLKETFLGTGSRNLTELEVIINRQAAKGYRLHTISTTNGGSKGLGGADHIQATLVFEKL